MLCNFHSKLHEIEIILLIIHFVRLSRCFQQYANPDVTPKSAASMTKIAMQTLVSHRQQYSVFKILLGKRPLPEVAQQLLSTLTDRHVNNTESISVDLARFHKFLTDCPKSQVMDNIIEVTNGFLQQGIVVANCRTTLLRKVDRIYSDSSQENAVLYSLCSTLQRVGKDFNVRVKVDGFIKVLRKAHDLEPEGVMNLMRTGSKRTLRDILKDSGHAIPG